jgi:hypothetical protein
MTDVAVRPGLARFNLSVLKTGLISALPAVILLAIFRPHSPDLVAQLARTTMAEATDGATWLTSWYGGISTPSYSLISPELMRLLGVWTVGLLSFVVTVYSAARILEGHKNARLAIVLVSFALTANLISGRITFGIGAAFASLSLMFYLRGQLLRAAVCAATCSLGSPLAGMFLIMAMLAAAVDRHRRRGALLLIASAGIPGAIIALLFPEPGNMPMQPFDIWLAAAACIAMWLCRPHAIFVRLTALIAIGTLIFWVFHTPVGSNVLRLPLVFMAPAVAVSASIPRRLMYVILTLNVAWMCTTSAIDLARGHGRSFDKAFYAPLLEQLPNNGAATNRIEVVDPKTHGPALYVAPEVPIARGWERQVDVLRNPLFYDNTLNADTYRSWLGDMAVKWVALPNAPLDYASQKEGDLVRTQLPYLHEVWSNKDWHLYEVQNAAPLATGVASVHRIDLDSIEFTATGPGEGDIKVAWVRNLNLRGIDGTTADGEVERSDDHIHYSVPSAGTYRLSNVDER